MTVQASLYPFLERLNHLIYQVWRIPYPETLSSTVSMSPPAPQTMTPRMVEPDLLTENPSPSADETEENLEHSPEMTPALTELSPTGAGRQQHIHWHSAKMSYRLGRVRIKTLHH
ncbi:MAG: hypothetical protein ACKN9E_14735 [Microcystaceae cyanobacterium]